MGSCRVVKPSRALARAWDRAEGYTWAVIVMIYGGWLMLLAATNWLPLWTVVPALAVTAAWHTHLQHELLHGHPTEVPWLNDGLATPPLSLIYPYSLFKRSHLEHHLSDLTVPGDDPESFYVTPDQWARSGPVRRWVLTAHNSLLGRFLLGPALAVEGLARQHGRLLLAGTPVVWAEWGAHGLMVALILWGVETHTDLPAWLYVLGVAYPANGLVMVRSYLEHRPVANENERTAIVESNWFWSLLFLNNNLHLLHHERPGEAWFRLRRLYVDHREDLLERNAGYVFAGYTDVARRYLLRPKDSPVHPLRTS